MACGIKTMYAMKQFLPEKTCLLLLNALVISHLHYPSILLQGLSQNLVTTLEKQLSWGVKACFNRQKIDSSSDLKIKHSVFPIRIFLDYKAVFISGNITINCCQHSGAQTQYQQQGQDIIQEQRNWSAILKSLPTSWEKSFFMRILPLWNTLPLGLTRKKFSSQTIKSKFKIYFSNRIAKEIEQPGRRKKCWRDYRFIQCAINL